MGTAAPWLRRTRWLALLSVPLWAGCGLAAPGPAAAPTKPAALRALAVTPLPVNEPSRQTAEIALTGSRPDRITAVAAAQGAGTVRVTTTQGRVLLAVPHASAFGILRFGRAHLPVLVAEADIQGCGSGGCAYTAYTYVPKAGRFESIPGGQGLTGPAYRWDAPRRRFERETESSPMFFGFGRLDRAGFVLASRLYDPLQHAMLQTYAYTARAGGRGAWVAAGAPSYTPDQPAPAGFDRGAPPGQIPQAYLTAVCLGLPREAASLTAPSANAAALYKQARRLLAPCDIPSFSQTAAHAAPPGTDLWLWAQTTATGRLRSFQVHVATRTTGGAEGVTAVTARPVALSERTASQVLHALSRSAPGALYLRRHRRAVAQSVAPETATSWTVTLAAGARGVATAFRVNARTGAVAARGG